MNPARPGQRGVGRHTPGATDPSYFHRCPNTAKRALRDHQEHHRPQAPRTPQARRPASAGSTTTARWLSATVCSPSPGVGHEGVLGQRLLDHGEEYFSYALGFAVIGLMWVRHHVFYRGIDHIDTHLTVINLVYLGLIAFLPYPTRILGLYGSQPAAVILYATTIVLVNIVARVNVVHALRAGLLTEAGRREVRRREHWFIVPAVFLASIPIAFASPRAALYCWSLLFILPALQRRLAMR
ncbi:MAG: DUF1211 domain-containing protein [Actinobacteria bacterium]|nr:MAG: DUF1211 domain-containing protein [Actinomycetota bacterium]